MASTVSLLPRCSRGSLRLGLLAVLALGAIPEASAQSVSITNLPNTVYSGNEYDVTVTTTSNTTATQLLFDLRRGGSSCSGCSVTATLTSSTQRTFNYKVTIIGNSQDNVDLRVRHNTWNKSDSTDDFDIRVATATKFLVEAPDSWPAGTGFNVTVKAVDASNRLAYGYSNSVNLTSDDPSATNLGSVTISNGTGSRSVTLQTPGSRRVTATKSGITSGSDTINITAGPATRFQIVALATTVAGANFGITVNALDTSGNTATSFSGIATLTSTDPLANSLGSVSLSNGTGTLASATLRTVGSQTIIGTAGSITGASTIAVTAGPATRLSVTAPSTRAAGSSFDVEVTAKDAFDNTTSYTPTVTLSSTDTQATGMTSRTLSGDLTPYPTIHKTAGTQRITATGNGTPSISGFVDVTITPAAETHLIVAAPPTATAGTPLSYTVNARDPYGNLKPTYTGTIRFTSVDGNATLPPDSSLSGGTGTFSATLKTAGTQTITGTDTTNPPITGTSNAINVAAGSISEFLFAPATQNTFAGSSFSLSVTAKDQYFNTVTSYSGPANITSSDGQAQLPTPATLTFTNGAATFSATLRTAGNQTIVVSDQQNSTVTSSSLINVAATTATSLEFSGVPATATAGQPFSFTVNAKDGSGNLASSYSGTLTFTTGDTIAVRPPDAPLTNGTGTFTATLRTAGSWTFTATDAAASAISGTSSAIAVQHGAFHHFLIEPVPTVVVAGEEFNFTVTAKDEFNNTVSNYAGSVSVTSTDVAATVPPAMTFAGGVSTAQASLKTAGDWTLTVADSAASVSQSTSISVRAAAPHTIEIVSGNNQQKTIQTTFDPLTVRVIDAYQNPISGWQVIFGGPSTGPSASFSPTSTAVTAANGQASITATANAVAGSYSVAVTASERPQRLASTAATSFSLTNLAGPPSSVEATSGRLQSAQVGTQFSEPLVVTVRDVGGNVLPNIAVTLTVPSSGASATLAPAGPYTTDASGRVTVNAIANAVNGSFSATASVAGIESASFPLTNLQAPPGTLTISRGSPQSAGVELVFGTPLEVIVRDAGGTPINDAPVAFYPIAGSNGASAELSGETVRTNASGVANVTATANTITGSYQIRAVALSGGTQTFELTNIPGTATNIEAALGAQQSTQINSYFSEPLRVRVVDRLGNGIPNIDVTFQAPVSGPSATLSPGGARTTNEQGYTSVTAAANSIAGSYFISARVQGVASPAAFSLENVQEATPTIVASAGSEQSVEVANLFPQVLQVAVRDGRNAPIPNVTVFFTPPATGASVTLSAPTAVTDAQGLASVRATANTVAGVYQVEATAPGISAGTTAIFNLTNRAGAAASITADPGTTPQSSRINIAFPNPLRVTVADSHGNPVTGATVTYTAPSSGASTQLSSSTNVTDSSGKALVTAVANGASGNYAVTASTSGPSSPATFNLTNVAGPPATIEILSGNAQTVAVGAAFSQLIVTVRDGSGNRLPGQTLTFLSPRSGASASAIASSISTDASGQAAFSVTANTVAGTYFVEISGPGVVTPAVFQLTNRAGPAARLVLTTGASQVAFTGAPFGFPLRVIVQDAYGNPASGASVTYQAPSTGATALLSSLTDISGPSGQASVNAIAGSVAGAYMVTASVAGVANAATFNLTNVPTTTTGQISATGGSNQTATTDSGFVTPLTVVVRDVRGNPVSGVTVQFSAPESGASASLSDRSLVTNSQGVVSVNAAANDTAGSYQVVATASGFAGPAVFILQNTTPTPGEAVITGIVNAASYQVGASPGSLQTIFGANLGTTTETAAAAPLPTALGGLGITIGGRPVPLSYVSPTQINFQVPPEVGAGRPELVITRGTAAIARAPLQINAAAPGIFLQINGDLSRAAALNGNNTTNVPSNPAAAGGYISMFLTGIGQVSPAIPAGQVAPLSPLSTSQLSVSATIGPRPVNVQFAGRGPTSLGDQVNLQIPVDLPPGDYGVVVRVNGVDSNSAIITVGAARQ